MNFIILWRKTFFFCVCYSKITEPPATGTNTVIQRQFFAHFDSPSKADVDIKKEGNKMNHHGKKMVAARKALHSAKKLLPGGETQIKLNSAPTKKSGKTFLCLLYEIQSIT